MVSSFPTPELTATPAAAGSAWVVRGVGQMAWQSVAPVVCPQGGAIVRLLAAGLCGSDVEKLLRPEPPVGTVLGHEVAAEIIDSQHPDWPVGTRLVTSHHVPCGTCQYCANGSESMCHAFKASNFVPGGFAAQFAISAGHLNHTAIRLPEGVALPTATAVEPLACVLKALRRAGTIHGQPKVAIVGLGFIGLLAAMAYRQQYGDALELIGVEHNPDRVQQINNLGLGALFTSLHTSEGWGTTNPVGVDQVFLTAVTPAVVETTLRHVRDGGTVVQFSRSLSEPTVTWPADSLYYREISVVPSYSPNLEDLHAAAELLFTKALDVTPLYTHHVPFTALDEGLTLYRSGAALKVWTSLQP